MAYLFVFCIFFLCVGGGKVRNLGLPSSFPLLR